MKKLRIKSRLDLTVVNESAGSLANIELHDVEQIGNLLLQYFEAE